MTVWKSIATLVPVACAMSFASHASAVSIVTGDNVFPLSAEVVAADPAINNFGDDASESLTQTFQVDTTFDALSITIAYEYDSNGTVPGSIDIEVFEVADVFASSITAGTSLFSATGVVVPGDADHVQFVLDSPLTLAATSGTAGYAFEISNGGNPGFEWRRTGGTRNNVYAFGQFYEDGVWKNSGERDGTLAISSTAIPEPHSFVLAAVLLGGLQLAGKRRG